MDKYRTAEDVGQAIREAKPRKPDGAKQVDPLFNTVEAGQVLGGRSADWVRRKCIDGTFAAVKDGGDWFVPGSELQRWINERIQRRTNAAAAVPSNWVLTELERRKREGRRKQPA